jgi:ATP-dependent Lon protease
MFLTTANTLAGIPLPLQDRMEIIELSELHRVREAEHRAQVFGPAPEATSAAWTRSTSRFQRERRAHGHPPLHAGERACAALEREIASVCRKAALRVVAKRAKSWPSRSSRSDVIPKLPGRAQVSPGQEAKRRDARLASTHGLSVTSEYGGDIARLPRSVVVPGKGKLVITGLLEKGMEESGQAAMSYIRSSRLARSRARARVRSKRSTCTFTSPTSCAKTGPSAGVTMVTAITSALLRLAV